MSGKRYPHYWWPVTGKRYPSRIAVLDCDSVPDTAPRIGGAVNEQLSRWCLYSVRTKGGIPDRRSVYTGEDTSSAWACLSQLLSSRDRTWLFCSPSSRILPLVGFWERLESGAVRLNGLDRRAPGGIDAGADGGGGGVCVIEDPPTVILCGMDGRPGKLLILDIRNWGIVLLGEELSCAERARRYVDGILSCLSALRYYGQVSLRGTAGSQAVQALRTDDGCIRLHCHTHPEALALERSSYFGGRCECYRIGEVPGPIYHLDVRSMYPALALTLALPVSLRMYHEGDDAGTAVGKYGTESAIAHVRIRSAVPAYPLRREGDAVYPVGEYNTHLCGPELTAAVQQSAITRWYACAHYTMRSVLAGYAERWLKTTEYARAQLDPMAVQFSKRVANAVFGKLGEVGKTWEAVDTRAEMGPYGQWYEDDGYGGQCRYRNIAWHTQRERIAGESYWSVPSCAAWITSAGRRRLWDYIATAGRENVWYTDTDSLLCNGNGYDRLLRRGLVGEGQAGYLRLIGQHSRCTIYGIRHYQLDDTITCAGVPIGAIHPGESREQYWDRQRIASEVAMGKRPGARRILNRFPRPEAYRHGRIMPGGIVLPLEIRQGD